MSLLEAILEPITNGGLFMELLWQFALFLILAASLDLVIGYAGMFQLGHIGFFALGAIGTTFGTHADYLGMDMVAGLLLGMLFTLTACGLIGVTTLRLTGDYFAIATLGFGSIAQVVLLGFWSNGIFDVPSMNPLGCDLDCMADTSIGGAVGGTISRTLAGGDASAARGIELAMVWAIALAAYLLMGRIKRSPAGRALKSIREDRHAAASLGKNVQMLRFKAFLVSALGASLAGGLWVHHIRNMGPQAYGFQFMILIIVMVILGGLGSNTGALLGAALVTILDQLSRSVTKWMGEQPWSGDTDMPSLRLMLFAALLVATMLLRPNGILGDREWGWQELKQRLRRQRS